MNFSKPTQALENAQGTVHSDPATTHARKLLRDLGLDPDHVPERTASRDQAARDWADAGAMSLTGDAAGPPQTAPGPLASAARGAGLVIEALAPDAAKASFSDRDWAALLGERAAIAGLTRNGRQSAGGAARLLETADGWIAVNLPRDDDWSLLPAWLEAELPPAPAVTAAVGTGANTDQKQTDSLRQDSGEKEKASANAWDAVATCVRKGRTEELVARGRLMGLAVASARRTLPESDAFTLSHRSERLESREPGRDVTRPGFDSSESSQPRLRVLDLSTLWAGPLATSILAEAGADVLKIEAPQRPDGARTGPKAFFDLMNARKRGAALDLRDPHSRHIFEKLLEQADVVFESARPRGLKQLGFVAEDWVRARPGRLWASITGYGRQHEWIAFGDDAAASAGLAWPNVSSPPDRPGQTSPSPIFCADAVADPLTGLHAAAIVLAHIKLGRGGLLDFSLRDIAAYCAAPTPNTETLNTSSAIARKHQDGWVIELDARPHPIALPRARTAEGVAPGIAAPTDAILADWGVSSC